MRVSRYFVACALLAAFHVTAARAQEPNFGRALAINDEELFVGQPVNFYGPGVVYVFQRAGSEWRERARLTAADSARSDDFGRSLALDGSTLVVGAPRKRNGRGVVYVFERAGGGAWRQTAMIEPPDTSDQRGFGSALTLHGNELLIGAPVVDSTGVVYQYERQQGRWLLRRTLRPSDASAPLAFGLALHRRANALIVGAPATDSARGRAYIYQRQTDGSWGGEQVLDLATSQRARLGASVLLTANRALVGAPGAARVFVLARNAEGGWSAPTQLQPNDSTRGSQFGHTVAMVGDELWVGAPGVNQGNGRVYRFPRAGESGQALTLEADSADGTAWPFQFGYAMAAHEGRAVVSMPQRDFGEGRVLALTRAGNQWSARQTLEGHIYTLGRELASGMRCTDGQLAEFPCSNIELIAHVPNSALGGARGVWLNDVWGWSDPLTRRDYALVARRDGAAFVDVTNPSQPRLVGSLPRTVGTPPSVWRDIKVIGQHAYIVADGAGAHGVQVFDLQRLRAVRDTPAVFSPDTTYHEIHSAHNVVADTATRFLYVVGANGGGSTCGGGLHMVDARAPASLRFAGCYNDRLGSNSRGYTHDAQCVVYAGPDTRYRGRQICVGSNESEINIADVTDKTQPVTVARASYPNVGYTHQGWFDEEQRYFYMNDEVDELMGGVTGTRTIVWDLTRLDDPVVAHQYIGPVRSSDHNLFVKGDRVYESNYGSGLRVLDISNRVQPREVGFLDSAPYSDDPGHSATQSGAWSNYPFFPSGVVIFTSVREGLFIVRVIEQKPVS